MERLEIRYNDARKAAESLSNILRQPFSIIVRDASIQRFEYTFEAFWKYIKEYLKVKEGIVCNAPKSCFREMFSVGAINEEETMKLLEMTDDRNMTSHTYKEEVAQIIYGKLKEYSTLIENIIQRFHS